AALTLLLALLSLSWLFLLAGLAAAGAHLLLEALAQLALLVGQFLAALRIALTLGLLGGVVEVALVVERAVGVLQRAIEGAVHRPVLLLSARTAATHLDLHVLHVVEQALHVREQLPRLIARAGLRQIAQRL